MSNSKNSKVPAVLILTAIVTAVPGAVLWLKGAYDIKKANGHIRKDRSRYDEERRKLEAFETVTNDALKVLGMRQAQANRQVVDRMADFLRLHKKQVSESEKLLVDGLESTLEKVALDGGLGQDTVSWMRGVIGTAVTGVGVNAGVTTAVTTFATASTGTAISSLSGAAATNATLAFLGGGSLASGGGGMAVGAAALNLVAIGPAILVSGFVVAGQGEKAKTKALKTEAAVNVAIAEAQITATQFDAVITRAEEIGTLLDQLVAHGISALDLLESELFDPNLHETRFQQALTLTFAVRDVALARVIDESGDLTEETNTFRVLYRTLIKEAENV